jgi:hypothetical protein
LVVVYKSAGTTADPREKAARRVLAEIGEVVNGETLPPALLCAGAFAGARKERSGRRLSQQFPGLLVSAGLASVRLPIRMTKRIGRPLGTCRASPSTFPSKWRTPFASSLSPKPDRLLTGRFSFK